MTAYYNEIDRFSCDWLSNLMDAGLITPGKIDDRSIVDVRPDDLAGFERVHFFAGIGGWDYALGLAGWPAGRSIWTGSCPCQPFSLAGAQKGFDDSRHLWPEFKRLIAERRPPVVFGEQVASAAQWLGLVRSDLEALGYAVGCIPIQAASAGADHLRDRYWFVADSQRGPSNRGPVQPQREAQERAFADGVGEIELADADDAGSQGRRLLPERAGERIAGPDGVADADRNASCSGRGDAGEVRSFPEAECKPEHSPPLSGGSSDKLCWVIGADGKARRVKPGIRLLAHGVPDRVGLLRGFGNAIDPRPAAAFIEAAMSALHSPRNEAMADVVISTVVVHTHRLIGNVEAWQYTGQKFENWPDWVRSRFQHRTDRPRPARGTWALRDDEGYFWKWLRNDLFRDRYEALAPQAQQDAT